MNKYLKEVNLYQEELMEHYYHPKNYVDNNKILTLPFQGSSNNPSCGDGVKISFNLLGKNISEIFFSGTGCVISQATASMLTELCKNKSLDFIKNISLNDIQKMINLNLGPNRLRCALLSLESLQKAVSNVK